MTGGGHDRSLSLWWDALGGPGPARDPLPGTTSADVAIVGAGYTGLWTAHALLRARPDLRVLVIEAQVAGFGASGRNGGWCSALFPASLDRIARHCDRASARAMRRALQDTIDEVGRFVADEGLDVGWVKGGTLSLLRSAAQRDRARAEVAHWRDWGFGEADIRLLDRDEAVSRSGATRLLGAVSTPHCATVQPAALVRGLAVAVERLGARIHEGTRALAIEPGVVRTDHGDVRAPFVVRATEGFTAALPGHRRSLLPVYSLMLATEPLPASTWDQVGLAGRETFNDHRHLIVYGQRTADGRLAFGGRGAPYHPGSRVDPSYDRLPAVHQALWETLTDMFPVLAGHRVTHRWGGPLGVPRDWFASVGLDRTTGLAWSGGYVGDGVATSNLGGRTLADLILGRDTDLVRLPWVGHRSPRWEPEPLRWLGARAGLAVMASADRSEERTGRPSRRARAFAPLIGH